MKRPLIRGRHRPTILWLYDLIALGLCYVVLAKVTGGDPTMAGYAVVIASTVLYRQRKRQHAEERALLDQPVGNVVDLTTRRPKNV